MWAPQPQRLRQDPVDRRDSEPDRGSKAIVRDLLAEGRTGRRARGARIAGGLQVGVSDRRLQRQRAARVRHVPLRRAQVHGGGVPRPRNDVRDSAEGHAPARRLRSRQGSQDQDDPGAARPGGLSRRAAADDRQGHVHHQRHRARRREPAATLRRRVLRRRQGQDPGVGQAALLGARHPLPRVVGRVRLRRERHPPRPRRPPPEDAGDGILAGVLVPGEEQPRHPLRRGDPGALLRV